jgi:hypothetical protein
MFLILLLTLENIQAISIDVHNNPLASFEKNKNPNNVFQFCIEVVSIDVHDNYVVTFGNFFKRYSHLH